MKASNAAKSHFLFMLLASAALLSAGHAAFADDFWQPTSRPYEGK